jgi:pimeloyl-ACP methyl ester carboxylesterase
MSNVRALEPERPAWLTRELFPFESRFVEVDGVSVHYADEGRGAVLLFLPGAPNWSFFYRRFVERFIELLGLRDIILVSAAEHDLYLAAYASRAARRNPVLLLADLAGNDAYMRDIKQALRMRLNHLPVLLWGDKDPVAEFLPHFHRIFPDARSLSIAGARHFHFAEAPEAMIAEIRRWWHDAAAASAAQRVS